MSKNPRHGPAVFWEVDLHVHTPASADVVADHYGGSEPHDVVRAAVNAGLDAIAITDHNTVAWCERVSVSAEGTGLLVLPGVELSTSEGHLLGIWETGTDVQELKDVLVDLGIKTKDFGKLDISTNMGFAEVAERVRESGGVAIAAHADGEKGLLKLKVAARRKKVLESGQLTAIEVLDPASCTLAKRQVDDSTELTFVRGSDSMKPGDPCHSLAGIGHRRTWIKASRPDLRGIIHALQDPALRVRLKQPRAGSHARIIELNVDGGFLDGETFRFSDDMTCLLGGTGSGKSLAIELIRFALDQQTPDQPQFAAVRSEVTRRLDKALVTNSTVELVATNASGDEIRVKRIYDEDGSPPAEVVDGNPDSAFMIRAFSQGEIIEYTRAPVGRMQLVDSGID